MADEINEKMEQIRIKNEELEKKHQEILQDELEAKKQGATVSKSQAVSCKTNEKHRYDNVELDYDVKDDQKEHAKNPDYKPKNRRPILGKKQLDEIPPDPVNFLRDNGDDQNNQDDLQAKRPQQQQQQNNRNRHNNNRNPRPRNHDDGNSGNKERHDDHQGGQRQRNPNHRPRPNPNNNNNRNNDGSDQKQAVINDNNSNSPRKTHPQQLRTERRSAPAQNTSMESSNSEQSPNDPKKGSTAPKQQPHQNRPRRPNNNDNNRPRPKPNRERIEGNNDITVEVTDEVRSVKLKSSEKTFGTGRVRPTNASYENAEATNDNAQSTDAKKQHKPRNHNNRKPKPKGPPQPEFQHPILDKIVITKTSVQDRLLRSKMIDEKDQEHQEPKVEVQAVPEPENN